MRRVVRSKNWKMCKGEDEDPELGRKLISNRNISVTLSHYYCFTGKPDELVNISWVLRTLYFFIMLKIKSINFYKKN